MMTRTNSARRVGESVCRHYRMVLCGYMNGHVCICSECADLNCSPETLRSIVTEKPQHMKIA